MAFTERQIVLAAIRRRLGAHHQQQDFVRRILREIAQRLLAAYPAAMFPTGRVSPSWMRS